MVTKTTHRKTCSRNTMKGTNTVSELMHKKFDDIQDIAYDGVINWEDVKEQAYNLKMKKTISKKAVSELIDAIEGTLRVEEEIIPLLKELKAYLKRN